VIGKVAVASVLNDVLVQSRSRSNSLAGNSLAGLNNKIADDGDDGDDAYVKDASNCNANRNGSKLTSTSTGTSSKPTGDTITMESTLNIDDYVDDHDHIQTLTRGPSTFSVSELQDLQRKMVTLACNRDVMGIDDLVTMMKCEDLQMRLNKQDALGKSALFYAKGQKNVTPVLKVLALYKRQYHPEAFNGNVSNK
jgi:hypothetical protein